MLTPGKRPTLEALPPSPWRMYVPLGDLNNCKSFSPSVTICAVQNALSGDSQAFTCILMQT